MSISVCPVAVTGASIERVWSLLIDPHAYGTWVDATVKRVVPEGRAHVGQEILLGAPKRRPEFAVRFVVESVDETNHILVLDAAFPFGLRLRTRITVRAIDASATRVQYG
jgi:hypothetical protein